MYSLPLLLSFSFSLPLSLSSSLLLSLSLSSSLLLNGDRIQIEGPISPESLASGKKRRSHGKSVKKAEKISAETGAVKALLDASMHIYEMLCPVVGTYKNKAGYTAISCGREGRGGNAHFPTFRLMSTDGPTDGPMDGRTKPLIELRVRN